MELLSPTEAPCASGIDRRTMHHSRMVMTEMIKLKDRTCPFPFGAFEK